MSQRIAGLAARRREAEKQPRPLLPPASHASQLLASKDLSFCNTRTRRIGACIVHSMPGRIGNLFQNRSKAPFLSSPVEQVQSSSARYNPGRKKRRIGAMASFHNNLMYGGDDCPFLLHSPNDLEDELSHSVDFKFHLQPRRSPENQDEQNDDITAVETELKSEFSRMMRLNAPSAAAAKDSRCPLTPQEMVLCWTAKTPPRLNLKPRPRDMVSCSADDAKGPVPSFPVFRPVTSDPNSADLESGLKGSVRD